jgi:hypothetical protein
MSSCGTPKQLAEKLLGKGKKCQGTIASRPAFFRKL